jgi:hypothetical protein
MIRDQTRRSALNRTALTRMFTRTVVVAAVAGAGFTERPGTPPPAAPQGRADLLGVDLGGSVAPQRVTLAPLAAERLAVSTAAVTAVPGNPADVSIPLDALIYDPQGLAWTYVVVGPAAYERVAVKVDHIDGDHVLISAGPRAGTPVVAAGAPELLGVEYGVGKE